MGRRTTNILTDLQRETLNVMIRHYDEEGVIPSCRDLAEELGVKHFSLYRRMDALIKKGYLARIGGRGDPRILKRPGTETSKTVRIPILGSVVAGTPLFAEENIEGDICIETSIVDPENCFAVRAFGTSMKDAGIKDGDILIVRQQRLASDGEIVIASINGESTVKRLRFKGSHVSLIPANRAMKPIKIGPNDDFRIQGVVISWKSREPY